MTLLAQALLTEDSFLIDRVAASAASYGQSDARVWAKNQMWPLSTSPEWAERYAAALEEEEPVERAAWAGRAGANPDVITDDMIRERVAAILAPPPPLEAQTLSPAE